MEIFRRHFGEKYDVHSAEKDERGSMLRRFFGKGWQFILKKNTWVTVVVRLEQSHDKTKFIFTGDVGSSILRGIVGGLPVPVFEPFLFLLWNGPTNEVESFIERSPDFR